MAGSVGQYTVGWFPWVASKANTNFSARTNLSTVLGMGRLDSTGAQNAEVSWDTYFDSVTWKYAQLHQMDPSCGIYSIRLDGVEQGTIDGYNSVSTLNRYDEITGLSVTTAAVKTFAIRMATKNASATNYYGLLNSCAWIRTGGTPSTPAGTDTPGYTWEWIPWMGSKANTGWSARTQESTSLGGGRLGPSTAQNDEVSADAWIDSGTVKIPLIHVKSPDAGIYSIQFDGVEKGVVDGYAAAEAQNSYDEVTGVTVAAGAVVAFKLKMATKNASSSAYAGRVHSAKVIRTGA